MYIYIISCWNKWTQTCSKSFFWLTSFIHVLFIHKSIKGKIYLKRWLFCCCNLGKTGRLPYTSLLRSLTLKEWMYYTCCRVMAIKSMQMNSILTKWSYYCSTVLACAKLHSYVYIVRINHTDHVYMWIIFLCYLIST